MPERATASLDPVLPCAEQSSVALAIEGMTFHLDRRCVSELKQFIEMHQVQPSDGALQSSIIQSRRQQRHADTPTSALGLLMLFIG